MNLLCTARAYTYIPSCINTGLLHLINIDASLIRVGGDHGRAEGKEKKSKYMSGRVRVCIYTASFWSFIHI